MRQTDKIAEALQALGVHAGDTILVHSSLKACGGASPEEVIDGLLAAVGAEGTLVLPTLSYAFCNPTQRLWNARTTPSCVGTIPEYFRTHYPCIRSLSPTHSCCAMGRNADEITAGHRDCHTPCGEGSPFTRVRDAGGKLVFLGCGLRPNTTMHAVEETVEPPYLFENAYAYKLTDMQGNTFTTTVRAHNFKGVGQRYDRLAALLDETELRRGMVLAARTEVLEATAVWAKGREKLLENPWFFVDRVDL